MKLRYYMRGLGIGVLITALILILSGRTSGQLSDEQIKARATELGMVMEDKSVLKESEASPSAALEETEEKPEEVKPEEVKPVEVEAEEQAEKQQKPEETASESKAENQQEAENNKPDEVKAEEQEEKQQEPENVEPEEAKPDEAESEAQAETVTITVRSGASSVSVAKQIEDAGLVSSAGEFDRYLCQNGYDKKICVGTYTIPMDATEEEIARAITKK